VRRVLYLVCSPSSDVSLLPEADDPSIESSVVLIEDAVSRRDIPSRRVAVLADDASARKTTTAYPLVSTPDLLRMIFEAESIVTI
jgi:hypothetical protein